MISSDSDGRSTLENGGHRAISLQILTDLRNYSAKKFFLTEVTRGIVQILFTLPTTLSTAVGSTPLDCATTVRTTVASTVSVLCWIVSLYYYVGVKGECVCEITHIARSLQRGLCVLGFIEVATAGSLHMLQRGQC